MVFLKQRIRTPDNLPGSWARSGPLQRGTVDSGSGRELHFGSGEIYMTWVLCLQPYILKQRCHLEINVRAAALSRHTCKLGFANLKSAGWPGTGVVRERHWKVRNVLNICQFHLCTSLGMVIFDGKRTGSNQVPGKHLFPFPTGIKNTRTQTREMAVEGSPWV